MIRRKERQHLKNFDWDVNSNPVQRLYLSENTFYMMEVTNNFIANVYYRVNVNADLTTIKEEEASPELRDKNNSMHNNSSSLLRANQDSTMIQ